MSRDRIWVKIKWGVMQLPISIQLEDYHLTLKDDHAKVYDRVKQAINTLSLSNMFPSPVITKVYKIANRKLIKEIEKRLSIMSNEELDEVKEASKRLQDKEEKTDEDHHPELPKI